MNWLLATRAVAHGVVAIMITFAQIDNVLNCLVLFGSLYLAASLGTTVLDRRYKLTSPSVGLPLIAPMVVATLAVAALASTRHSACVPNSHRSTNGLVRD